MSGEQDDTVSDALTFSVSPDFDVRHLPGWYVVNTWLQRQSTQAVALQTFEDFAALHRALAEDRIDLIYANAFDAAQLVRDRGFIPLARPHGNPDEAVVAVKSTSTIDSVEDLGRTVRVAATDNPEVEMISRMLLEPADLGADGLVIDRLPNFVTVAKALLYDEADLGFFLAASYDDVSAAVRSQLRVLVRSEIFVISHLFLLHPRLAHLADGFRHSLMVMDTDLKGIAALDDVGIRRWDPVGQEEVEFMIDLMHALQE